MNDSGLMQEQQALYLPDRRPIWMSRSVREIEANVDHAVSRQTWAEEVCKDARSRGLSTFS